MQQYQDTSQVHSNHPTASIAQAPLQKHEEGCVCNFHAWWNLSYPTAPRQWLPCLISRSFIWSTASRRAMEQRGSTRDCITVPRHDKRTIDTGKADAGQAEVKKYAGTTSNSWILVGDRHDVHGPQRIRDQTARGPQTIWSAWPALKLHGLTNCIPSKRTAATYPAIILLGTCRTVLELGQPLLWAHRNIR